MKKDYTFKRIDNIPFLYDSDIEDVIKNFKITLSIASLFIKDFLNTKSFFLKLIKEEFVDNNHITTFTATYNSNSLTLKLINNLILIDFKNKRYIFNYNWDKNNYYAVLIFYQEKFKNRLVSQKIESHNLIIEICINDKKYCLYLPYDTNYYLDANYFNQINENTTILDLKRIYQTYFYPGQKDYDKSLESIISISQIIEDGSEVLLDKLVIVKGFISEYLLSSMKNGIQISISGTTLQNGKITINNYHGEDDINILEEIKKIYVKSRKIHFN